MRKRTPPEDAHEQEEGDVETTKLTWEGPSGQVVVGVGSLENGESYEIESTLAKSLVRSSQHWKEA